MQNPLHHYDAGGFTIYLGNIALALRPQPPLSLRIEPQC